jgi:hypothetical protein
MLWVGFVRLDLFLKLGASRVHDRINQSNKIKTRRRYHHQDTVHSRPVGYERETMVYYVP